MGSTVTLHLAELDSTAEPPENAAQALDRTLERAPLPSLAEEAALAVRILAAARRSHDVKVGGTRRQPKRP